MLSNYFLMDPVKAFSSELDRFFGHELQDSPAVNISEVEDGYNVKVVVPGFKKENISVSYDAGVLLIKGSKEKEEVKDALYHKREISTASFERSFRFKHLVDSENIVASYENGILSLELPKAEEAKLKKIEVK